MERGRPAAARLRELSRMNTGPLRGVVIHLFRREWLTSRWTAGEFVKVPYSPWDTLARTVGFDLWGRRAKIREDHGLSPTACLWCFREDSTRSCTTKPARATTPGT